MIAIHKVRSPSNSYWAGFLFGYTGPPKQKNVGHFPQSLETVLSIVAATRRLHSLRIGWAGR